MPEKNDTFAPVHVVLPCRAGSQRIKNKNTRPFAGNEGGLIGVKLEQLSRTRNVASVIVTTDDPVVMEISEAARGSFSIPFEIIPRPHELAISDSLDAFVRYIPTIVPDGVVLWTHVTSPFFGATEIDKSIDEYRLQTTGGKYDSLMGVTKIQTFLWGQKGCISHNREEVKWPQTQDLDPIYEVNSSIFMIDRASMEKRCDRIGDRPFLFETEKLASFDIDWPDDFEMAEQIMSLPKLKEIL